MPGSGPPQGLHEALEKQLEALNRFFYNPFKDFKRSLKGFLKACLEHAFKEPFNILKKTIKTT